MDRAGRLQAPIEYPDSIRLIESNKIRVELKDDWIIITNPNKNRKS